MQAKPAPKPVAKTPQKSATSKSAINPEETLLTKPIAEMNAQELADYEQKAAERRNANKSALPQNLIPHPTPQALEMMYMNLGQNLNVSSMRPYRLE